MGKRVKENEGEEEKNELVKMSKYSETGLAQQEAGVMPDHVTIRERRYANMHSHTDVCFSIMVGLHGQLSIELMKYFLNYIFCFL